MFLILLSFLSLLLFALHINCQSTCKDAPFPYKFSSDATCSSPRILNSSLPSFPAALKAGTVDMTIDFEVKLHSTCPDAVGSIELFGLTVNKPDDNSLVQIMRLFYLVSDLSYHLEGSFGATTQSLKSVPTPIAIGDQFHILMQLSFQTGLASNAKGIFGAPGVTGGITGNLAVPNAIKFDLSTKFFFCTDKNKIANAYCEIIGFATWYTFDANNNRQTDFSGLHPIPLAFYQFYQGYGHVIHDSYSNLGDAYLGTSTATTFDPTYSPTWNSVDNRIHFTGFSQYITLPTFPVSRYNQFKYSLSVSCWVKISASSYGYIFNYIGPDVKISFFISPNLTFKKGTTKFSIFLGQDHKVYGQIGDSLMNSVNSVTVPINTWTLISVFLVYADLPLKSFIVTYIGLQYHGYIYNTVTTPISLSSDNVVTLGPFLGDSLFIDNVKIFSPGAVGPERSSPCSTPTSFCDISLGPPNVQNCLTCKSNSYMKNFGCYPECYTYSDGSCRMQQCAYPYIPRNETYIAYCDFKCDSSKYLYPDGSCLSTCISPLLKYQNLTDEWYCKPPCADSKGFYYPDQKVCLVSCSDSYEEDFSLFYKRCLPVKTSETIKSTIEVTGKAGTASRAVTQATTALSSGSPTGISASVAGKIFTNIKYLNISYSVELLDALESWGESFVSLGFLPDLPVSIAAKVVERPVPYMFEKYEVGSSFLLNFWNNFCFLIILTFIFTFVKILDIILEKCFSKKFKLDVIRAMVQNFILTQLYSVYGDIIFYSTLEYRSLDFSLGLTGLSFSLSIVFIGIMFICFGLHLFLLKKYQRIKQQAKISNNQNLLNRFIDGHKGNFVLFKDFKDNLIIQQAFLFFLTARDLASSLIITTMFLHPLGQTILLLVLNLSMVAYLIWYRPFDSLFDATQQLFYEIITLSVNVSVLIMAIMDVIHSSGFQLRRELGKFLIIMNMIFNFGALAFMLLKGGMVTKEIYDSYKAKKRQQRKSKLSDLPLQRRRNISLNSQSSKKATKVLESSGMFEQTASEKQEEIILNSSVNQSLNPEESTIGGSGWDHAHSRRLIRVNTKRPKIKRNVQESAK